MSGLFMPCNPPLARRYAKSRRVNGIEPVFVATFLTQSKCCGPELKNALLIDPPNVL